MIERNWSQNARPTFKFGEFDLSYQLNFQASSRLSISVADLMPVVKKTAPKMRHSSSQWQLIWINCQTRLCTQYFIHTSYATLSSGITWNIPWVICIFSKYALACRLGRAKRERFMTIFSCILYPATENTVPNTVNEGHACMAHDRWACLLTNTFHGQNI